MNVELMELNQRKNSILKFLDKENFDGLLVLDSFNMFYLCNFYHVTTERPIVYFIHKSGGTLLFVPSLEEEEALGLPNVDSVKTYFEYPGKFDIIDWVCNEIKALYKDTNKVAADNLSLSMYRKFQNKFSFVDESNVLYKMRLVKSDLEVEYLKKAGTYGDFIVDHGFKIIEPGRTEIDVLFDMQSATINKMIKDMGKIIYVPGGPASGLIPSGKRTALPHALPSAKVIEKGDTMILSCGANVHGYRVECERTCFVGEPDAEKIKAFEVMREAQEMAIDLMKIGIRCSEIDKEIMKYIIDHGYGKYIRHRTGHGKGLCTHEAPWIDEGDDTVLQKGMVLSSEPGIYIDGFSGFRHSDTIVVTDDKPLIVTAYPKDLESLVKLA